MTSVLFVCLGNICRSPTAEGVFRTLVEREGLTAKITVDSAGTAAYHAGEPPDARAQAAAREWGVDLSMQRARQVLPTDFERFDLVLAMDDENLSNLQRLCPPQYRDRVRLFLDFASENSERNVPDPYYGGDDGFEHVLDLVEAASRGLLSQLRVSQDE